MTPTSLHTTSPAEAHAPKGWGVWLRNKFLAGLALALPLIITFWILYSIYDLMHGWSKPVLAQIVSLVNELSDQPLLDIDDPKLENLTNFIGFLFSLLVILGLGFMATNVIGVHFVTAVDKLLLRIPLVAVIYRPLKQVIDAFRGLGATKQNFKRVVFVDYPVTGMRMIGFATGQYCDPHSGKAQTCVLLPTAPSPMTGILLVVDSEKVSDAPITIEEAMKMIISGGLVVPVNAVPPLNQKMIAPPLPESLPVPEPEPELPAGLPRAEDFDAGDTEILAQALDIKSGKRWLRALPWKKR
ncbi:MAG: DUF502 domain-containing protein [Prosthecobacter sp.]|jgi:uncharacterized membrane protein|uniref:DUF502 domain-containing protein n=1 Tax=Prosthecobacter sp. TaxID=1965333 RepID=UPI0019ECB44A|nr:DUF502 domain-containing protein [Prosthecobacter sp.]MBE2284493.1 DUF502 domain-containing protein [Prosthecobacter sp.]